MAAADWSTQVNPKKKKNSRKAQSTASTQPTNYSKTTRSPETGPHSPKPSAQNDSPKVNPTIQSPDFARVRGLPDTKLPQIEWCEHFPKLSEMKEPQTAQLAFACLSLLAYLRQVLHRDMSIGYRIEMHPQPDSSWKLVLRITSQAWFDLYLRDLKNGEEAAEICRNYLDGARDKIRNTIIPDPSDLAPHLDSEQYCRDLRSFCKRRDCTYQHANIGCDAPAVRPDGAVRKCGWRVHNDRIINVDSYKVEPMVVVYARADPIRDIIIAPTNHTTNAQMVTTQSFWQSLLKIIERYFDFDSPELIYLNFGIWETQTSEDTRAADCHAHAHVNLTRKAVDEFGRKYKALQGRVNNPDNFLQQECDAVESRLNSLEIKNLRESVKGVKNSVDKLSENIDKIMEKLNILLSNH